MLRRNAANTNVLQFWYSVAVIVIMFVYQVVFLGQEVAKGPCCLRVKPSHAQLSTTHGGDFTLSGSVLNIKHKSSEYQFL